MSPKEKRRRVRMATRKHQKHGAAPQSLIEPSAVCPKGRPANLRFAAFNMQMGLSAYCGEPTLHGRRSCEKCRDKRREDYDFYNAKRRLNYRADRAEHRDSSRAFSPARRRDQPPRILWIRSARCRNFASQSLRCVCERCHKIMDVQWTFAQCADCLKKQRDGGRTNEQDDRDR